MKRDYSTGESNDIVFFYGKEIEHTPAFEKNTLFVVGLPSIDEISSRVQGYEHIFFGANHSFNPKDNLDWQRWETIIQFFLDKEYLCSLDIPVALAEEFLENGLNEHKATEF